jgi:rhodanese-related sulfurtransferase
MHHIDNDELRLLLDNHPDMTVLDVRTLQEFDELGHIPGAQNFPVQEINDWADRISATEPVVVICQHGRRSVYAGEYLENQMGVATVYNLIDGMAGWDGEVQS